MTFGTEGKEGARVHNINDIGAILDAFQEHGHYEVCAYFPNSDYHVGLSLKSTIFID